MQRAHLRCFVVAAAVLASSAASAGTSAAGTSAMGTSPRGNVVVGESSATMNRARRDPAPSARRATPDRLVPGEGLIKLRGIQAEELVSASSKSAALSAWQQIEARTGVDLKLIRPTLLGWAYVELREGGGASLPDEPETLKLLARLAADPAVAAVGPNTWYRTLTVPNDPYYGFMWHLESIEAEAAWDYTTGSTQQRVGIIDTGLVRDHEDVGARAVAGHDFISDSTMANDGSGRDADYEDAGDGCGGDSSWHGTHVAGTIGAAANNGKGIAGLNWRAGLVIARALGCGGGHLVDIYEGAAWMAGLSVPGVPDIGSDKVQVMNLSLGADAPCSSYEQEVIDFIEGQGVVFVVASGNSSTESYVAPVGSPANCDNVIAVAAHGPNRDITDYSSFGPEVDIVAPGGDFRFGNSYGVLSTRGPDTDLYSYEQGTSMAAPHVAGVVSLMLDIDPSLTRAQVVSLLQTTGTTCNGCDGKRAMVASDAVAAVDPSAPPPVPGDEDDAYEENDEPGAAKSGVGCGSALGLMALAADQDWFVLPTGVGQEITISLSATNGADLDLYVANDDLEAIAQSATVSGDEQVTFTGGGTPLLVLVDPYVDTNAGISHNGPYTLSVSCVGGEPPPEPEPEPEPAPADDALEDNDTQAAAAEFFCDGVRDLIARDEDWFFVDALDGDKVAVELTSPGRPLGAQIVGADGNVLAEGSALETAQIYPVQEGRYFIRIVPEGGGGAYKLRVACIVPDADSDGNGGDGIGDPMSIDVTGGCASVGGSPPGVCLLLLARLRRRRPQRR